jgi:hypothetical protein
VSKHPEELSRCVNGKGKGKKGGKEQDMEKVRRRAMEMKHARWKEMTFPRLPRVLRHAHPSNSFEGEEKG